MLMPRRSLTILVGLLLVLGTVIGGGPTSPRISMLVELMACLVAVGAIAGLVDGRCPRNSWSILILLCAVCLMPLCQIIPLPPTISQMLPGHEIPDAILRLTGSGDLGRPISLDTERTMFSALALIVPSAAFLAFLQINEQERKAIMVLIVGMALLSALLGIFQVAAGGELGLGIYPQVHVGYPIGFFANRNHEGDLLLIAILVGTHLICEEKWSDQLKTISVLCLALFFGLCVVATQSRTAFSLLPIALGGAVWLRTIGYDPKKRLMTLAFLSLLTILAIGFVDFTHLGNRLIHRFSDSGDDLRVPIWHGTMPAIVRFMPFGSGIGTFVPVYKMYEDLDTIMYATVNHAHNDYLEIVLETGIFGLAVFTAYAGTLISSMLRGVPEHIRRAQLMGFLVIAILLLHSITDYPLRTFGLSIVFAFANALLYQPKATKKRNRRTTEHLEHLRFGHD